MTQKSLPRNGRNARTNREDANKNTYKHSPGAGSHKSRESIIIHGGVTRTVIVKGCSNCGYKLQANKVECQTILTRFKCPQCGNSIENSNQNRCPICHSMCADSETLNGHVGYGCPYAGRRYPWEGIVAYRDENPKEKVTP